VDEHLVGRLEEIPREACLLIQVRDRAIGVLRVGDRLHAFENRCLHQGGPVCMGRVLGKLEEILAGDHSVIGERFSKEELHLICPWHGWEYDIETGECVADRRLRLKKYQVIVKGGDVYVLA
jgi:nitrite reductase (NADH) small subunit